MCFNQTNVILVTSKRYSMIGQLGQFYAAQIKLKFNRTIR